MANSPNGIVDVAALCAQRKRQQLYNVPPFRTEIVSPYISGQFNQYQLDMRRKAEVLKYKSNSTKGNKLTKKQQFSQIINATYNGPTLYCPQDAYLPTLSSSCDVPGPITTLFLDENVPLYNYATNTNSYPSNFPALINGWSYFTNNNIAIPSNTETTLFTIYVRNNIQQSSLNFSFSTPIAFYTSGTAAEIFDISMNLNTTNILCNVYYNSALLKTVNPSLTFQGQPKNDILIHGNVSSYFNATIYYGILTVTNIKLETSPGFIYDIKLTFPLNVQTPINEIDIQTGGSFGVICNLSRDQYLNSISLNQVNCNISQFSTEPYSSFGVSAS